MNSNLMRANMQRHTEKRFERGEPQPYAAHSGIL